VNVLRPRFDGLDGLAGGVLPLAHCERFAIGPVMVEPALRTIRGPDGATATLEPLAMKVLIALAEASGAPCTRDDLVSQCWDQRIVGDDAVNRVISRLRACLKTVAGDAVAVETIAKVGYRLRGGTQEAAEPALPVAAAVARSRPWSRSALLGALVALLLFGGWAVWRWSHPNASRLTTLSIAPVEAARSDPTAAEFAADITGDIAELAGSIPRVGIVEPKLGAKKTDLTVLVSIDRRAPALGARVRLVDNKSGVVVWSRDFWGQESAPELLRQQTAYGIAGIVRCGLDRSADAFPGIANRRLFFDACDTFQRGPPAQAMALARRLTLAQPDAPVGWSVLAMSTVLDAEITEQSLAQAAMAADRYAKRAMALDPHSGWSYMAQAAAFQAAGRPALDLLRRGIATDPDFVLLQQAYSMSLFNAGYVARSVAPALRAAALEPLTPDAAAIAARRLVAAGRTREGLAMQDEIERHWGATDDIWRQRVAMLRYGPDPRAAAARLAARPLSEADTNAEVALELSWRADPKAFDWSAFDKGARELAAKDPINAWALAAMAVRMHDMDRAFGWLERAPVRDAKEQWSLLFWPEIAELRRDPRFFAKMARLGLVKQWRKSGDWPDFCSEPGLRYDCSTEAARLGDHA
jgi:DNA-binding winged helix-turn-helix (wHTH) protein